MTYRIREENGKFQAQYVALYRSDVDETYQIAYPLGSPVDTLAEAKAIIQQYNKEVERITAILAPPPPKFHPYP